MIELGHSRPLIGVIHLPPLPGSPRFSGRFEEVVAQTHRDGETLARAGFDAVIVENFGDTPFYRGRVPAETVAAMAVLVDGARRACGLPMGVNVLRNDGESAVAIAAATGARFVRINVLVGARVTDQGLIQSESAEVLRARARLGAQGVSIVADVDVKHSSPLGDARIDDEAVEAVERALAEVLVVTGARTGTEADTAVIDRVRRAAPGVPLWLGSGARRETLGAWLAKVDGVIVGSDIRANGVAGGPVDYGRARAFVDARAAIG